MIRRIAGKGLAICGLAGAAALALGPEKIVGANETTSATYTVNDIAPGEWQYDITLDDTGTTNVGTYWFSWVPGDDFMPVSPISETAPTGWKVNAVTHGGSSDGYAIRWEATTALITPGNSLSGFTFDSDLSPQALAGNSTLYPTFPNTTAFIYSDGPFSDGGFGFTARPTPEPGALSLPGLGLGALVPRRKRDRATSVVVHNKARV
ncbi:MAG TPA: hypothetical protein VKJ65_10475 [Phycisphaerae bacterium]|nr:hypothetical protein [Phycisphaerae bacterium]